MYSFYLLFLMFLFYTFILILHFYVSPILYSKFNGNYTQNGFHCKLLFLDNRIFIVFKFTRPLGLYTWGHHFISLSLSCVCFFICKFVIYNYIYLISVTSSLYGLAVHCYHYRFFILWCTCTMCIPMNLWYSHIL